MTGPATKQTRVVAALVAGAVLGVLAAACTGSSSETDGEPSETRRLSGTPPDPLAKEPELRAANRIAHELETVSGDAALPACQEAAAELDAIGSPQQLAEQAASLPDPNLADLAGDQLLAVSSLMAACRGDAPVTVRVAVRDLKATNDAYDKHRMP